MAQNFYTPITLSNINRFLKFFTADFSRERMLKIGPYFMKLWTVERISMKLTLIFS